MTNSRIIYNSRWLFCCLIFLAACTGGGNAPAPQSSGTDSAAIVLKLRRADSIIKLATPLIQNGDIITRTGNDFTSETLRKLNQRDKTFSHIGIAAIENDSVYVFHALGGDFNPNQKILHEPLYDFVSPYGNRTFGIFRFDVEKKLKNKYLEKAKAFYRQGTPFDMDFNLATDDKLYCAEFVAKSIKTSLSANDSFNISSIDTLKFYGVDDVFLHPKCKKIYSANFNSSMKK